MTGPLVEVLLSAFDGERHLRAQVDSVLEQQGVRVRLCIRDDGSRDRTLPVLGQYRDDSRVLVERGEHLGLPTAFFQLVEQSGPDADLWALADQDDVWLPHKLQRAAEKLAAVTGPALYCARVLVVDEDLHSLRPHPLPRRGVSFANAMVQNVATGCTIVINSEARDVLRGRWPRQAVMHDAWLYLVISGTGTVLYDPEPVVQYRQHGRNAVGVGRGAINRTLGRVRRQLAVGGAGAHGRQNAELARTHAELLRPEPRAELEAFLGSRRSLVSRVRYAVGGAAHRQTPASDVVLRALHVLGRV